MLTTAAHDRLKDDNRTTSTGMFAGIGARATARTLRLPLALMMLTVILHAVLLVPAAQARQPQAAIVVDARTGKVLFARHADSPRYPASISKVMTLYLLFREIRAGRLSLNSRLKVSRRAALIPPSKLWLKPGQTITVDQAIRALAVKSANDVATVVAENIAGSEAAFARRMTQMARALGMTRTTFRNASGLPNPPNVSTARDLATLSLRLMRDFPHFYKRYFALKTFRWRGRALRNHNRLLWSVAGMDGIKTGYTRAAGSNLAASVRRNGKRIVAVVLGMPSSRARNRYMASLIEKSFRQYRLQKGTRIAAIAGTPPGWNPARGRAMLARLQQMERASTSSARHRNDNARKVAARMQATRKVRPQPRVRQAQVAVPAPQQAARLARLALQAAVIPTAGDGADFPAPADEVIASKKTATAGTSRITPPKPQPRPGNMLMAKAAQPASRRNVREPESTTPRMAQADSATAAESAAHDAPRRMAAAAERSRTMAGEAGAHAEVQIPGTLVRVRVNPVASAEDAATTTTNTPAVAGISNHNAVARSAKAEALSTAVGKNKTANVHTAAVLKADVIREDDNSAVMVLVRKTPARQPRVNNANPAQAAGTMPPASRAATDARPDDTHGTAEHAPAPRQVAQRPASSAPERSAPTIRAGKAAAAAIAAAASAGGDSTRVAAAPRTEAPRVDSPAEEILLPEPDRARQLMQARWLIQIGAFPTLEGAKKYLEKARRLSRNVRGEQPVVIRVRKGTKMFYRARYAGMSRRQAIRACRELKRRGLACLPMAPGAG